MILIWWNFVEVWISYNQFFEDISYSVTIFICKCFVWKSWLSNWGLFNLIVFSFTVFVPFKMPVSNGYSCFGQINHGVCLKESVDWSIMSTTKLRKKWLLFHERERKNCLFLHLFFIEKIVLPIVWNTFFSPYFKSPPLLWPCSHYIYRQTECDYHACHIISFT